MGVRPEEGEKGKDDNKAMPPSSSGAGSLLSVEIYPHNSQDTKIAIRQTVAGWRPSHHWT